MALLSTEDSNDSQKRMRAVLTIHPTLAYPFFSLIRPLFLRVLPKGGQLCEGLLYTGVGRVSTLQQHIQARTQRRFEGGSPPDAR